MSYSEIDDMDLSTVPDDVGFGAGELLAAGRFIDDYISGHADYGGEPRVAGRKIDRRERRKIREQAEAAFPWMTFLQIAWIVVKIIAGLLIL